MILDYYYLKKSYYVFSIIYFCFVYLKQTNKQKSRPFRAKQNGSRSSAFAPTSLPDAARRSQGSSSSSSRRRRRLYAAPVPSAALASRLINDSSVSLSLITRHHTHSILRGPVITVSISCGRGRGGNVRHFVPYRLRSRRCFQVSYSISFSGGLA